MRPRHTLLPEPSRSYVIAHLRQTHNKERPFPFAPSLNQNPGLRHSVAQPLPSGLVTSVQARIFIRKTLPNRHPGFNCPRITTTLQGSGTQTPAPAAMPQTLTGVNATWVCLQPSKCTLLQIPLTVSHSCSARSCVHQPIESPIWPSGSSLRFDSIDLRVRHVDHAGAHRSNPHTLAPPT
ncbi:hypothetical protein P171DRAFT_252198 [Karstenula rhodostoma CBS 690.94]|uniref:Uncharacterized protein n=1 Tax=Karstenula rhodostoma CBS 690.94 TaxID=1392251 RepID=A0A9P4UE55_9PLEO|nr:hypothetical protein P171DRAFT_252198 [Karstenula rhodostoma CBS 690.94]